MKIPSVAESVSFLPKDMKSKQVHYQTHFCNRKFCNMKFCHGKPVQKTIVKSALTGKSQITPTDHVLDAMIIFFTISPCLGCLLQSPIFMLETVNGSYEAGRCSDALLTHFSQILQNIFTFFLHPAKYSKIVARGST